MEGERSQGADSRQDKGNPFCLDPKKHFDIRKNRGEGDEDTEVNHARAGHSEPRPEAGQSKEKRGRPEEQDIEDNKSAAANGTFHLAAECEEHVHFDREPEERRSRVRHVDKSVGDDLPNASHAQDLRAVEDQEIQKPGRAERREETSQHHQENMKRDEQGRDMDRMPAYPCHWLVVIRGGDSEHAFN